MKIINKILIIFVMGLAWSSYQVKADVLTVALSLNSVHNSNISTMDKEVWKDIPEYEGLYQISNLGKVKSLDKYVFHNTGYRLKKEHLLTVKVTKKYGHVLLYKNGKSKNKRIHRLVGLCFIDNPFNKQQINHKDGNTLNNNHKNLEWVTASENIKHSYDTLGRKTHMEGKKGYENPNSHEAIQLDLKGNEIKRYGSIAVASEVTGINQSGICQCCNDKAKTAGGYLWVKGGSNE